MNRFLSLKDLHTNRRHAKNIKVKVHFVLRGVKKIDFGFSEAQSQSCPEKNGRFANPGQCDSYTECTVSKDFPYFLKFLQ